MKSKRTKALEITMEVKRVVHERDSGCCIYCGKQAVDIMHFISRGRLGLGIKENLACGCRECHAKYDHSGEKKEYEKKFRNYLNSLYPDFEDEDRIYKKGGK